MRDLTWLMQGPTHAQVVLHRKYFSYFMNKEDTVKKFSSLYKKYYKFS